MDLDLWVSKKMRPEKRKARRVKMRWLEEEEREVKKEKSAIFEKVMKKGEEEMDGEVKGRV